MCRRLGLDAGAGATVWHPKLSCGCHLGAQAAGSRADSSSAACPWWPPITGHGAPQCHAAPTHRLVARPGRADAISAVGMVLEHYDTDKRFPTYGFGAGLPPSFTASHCFALNGNPSDPEVEGMQGILQAYRWAPGAGGATPTNPSGGAGDAAGVHVSGQSSREVRSDSAYQVPVCRAQWQACGHKRRLPTLAVHAPAHLHAPLHRRQALNSVRLSGPTLFAPVIQTAAQVGGMPGGCLGGQCWWLTTERSVRFLPLATAAVSRAWVPAAARQRLRRTCRAPNVHHHTSACPVAAGGAALASPAVLCAHDTDRRVSVALVQSLECGKPVRVCMRRSSQGAHRCLRWPRLPLGSSPGSTLAASRTPSLCTLPVCLLAGRVPPTA